MNFVLNQKSFPHLEKGKAHLPRLPLPTLEETLANYLKSVEGLAGPQFDETKKLAAEFAKGDGATLDAILRHIHQQTPTSWLEGFWDTTHLDKR